MQPCITRVLLLLAFITCKAQAIMVPTGKVGPITPARSTPRPTFGDGIPRSPAGVVEYSPDNPEPAPLDPSYVPPTYKTLTALSGSSVFYIPLKIKNIYGYNDNSINHDISNPKELHWKGSYDYPQKSFQVRVPIQEIDYTFPNRQRQPQPIRPIIVAPVPQQIYNKLQYQQQYTQTNEVQQGYNKREDLSYKKKVDEPQEDKAYNNPFPKKAFHNEGSTKYYYFVKHN